MCNLQLWSIHLNYFFLGDCLRTPVMFLKECLVNRCVCLGSRDWINEWCCRSVLFALHLTTFYLIIVIVNWLKYRIFIYIRPRGEFLAVCLLIILSCNFITNTKSCALHQNITLSWQIIFCFILTFFPNRLSCEQILKQIIFNLTAFTISVHWTNASWLALYKGANSSNRS